ncbi:MAG: NAD(+)/NADH kinase [Candidatus Saganbacteria bacterium]|nr:NAD(+)/NADH kinase [Candidatus Saganbacteria bacterium]
MKKVTIIYKEEDTLVEGTAKQLAKDLEELGYKANLDLKNVKGSDLFISIGGDGTIFRTSRYASKVGAPILGIYMGGVGFLTEISLLELQDAMDKIKHKKYKLETRSMLKGEVLRKGKKVKEFIALNDLVISKKGIARIVSFEVYAKGELIGGYKADGLIISSATGSTAYNLSAGGPLLLPESRECIVTAICPHTLINQPIVTSTDLTVKLLKGKDALLTSDGQELFALETEDEILVSRAAQTTQFIRINKYNFFERIREKLGKTV